MGGGEERNVMDKKGDRKGQEKIMIGERMALIVCAPYIVGAETDA